MTKTAKTPRREFLQLADTFDAEKHDIGGYYISEKLDGTRCFWDGGITRGIPTKNVPWASTVDPKTGTAKGKVKPTATGLWSRYGNPIIAPEWFLNALPCCPLDGELWAGRGNFQLCRSICGGDTPDPRFKKISYAVYSSPPLAHIFQTGEIKNANLLLMVDYDEMQEFLRDRISAFKGNYQAAPKNCNFEQELLFLQNAIETQNDQVFLHKQTKLPVDPQTARDAAKRILEGVLDQGGEGCVIRDPSAVWTPKRHRGLLKYKPFEDSEAIVLGYVAGKEGKQGNVLGKIGALRVRTTKLKRNVEFEIGSGLTMQDRELASPAAVAWAEQHPEEELPAEFAGKYLRRGATITFKFRELSDEGIPKEGRMWRRRDDVE
jgi:DNA ligase-1